MILATQILEEYAQVGAVKRLDCQEMQNTRHLIPWFVISKKEGDSQKHRLISDCRELNKFFAPQKVKLDTIQAIFPFLRKGTWAAKIDLKDAYFHLQLAQHLKK